MKASRHLSLALLLLTLRCEVARNRLMTTVFVVSFLPVLVEGDERRGITY
jgi:hypothetical protein